MSGWFGLLGSGEFLPWSQAVDAWLLSRATGDGRVLVLPTASAPEGDQIFGDWSQRGLEHYGRSGISVEVLPVRDRIDADDANYAEKIAGASMVFFSGGNPAYLAATLMDTAVWRAITHGLDRGMAYGGCSAGMACLGRNAPDSTVNDLDGGLWAPGLAVFPHAWLGPHWDMLDRYTPGLVDHIVGSVPDGDILLGIDEETAIVGDGRTWDVLGRGRVHVYGGPELRQYSGGEEFAGALLS